MLLRWALQDGYQVRLVSKPIEPDDQFPCTVRLRGTRPTIRLGIFDHRTDFPEDSKEVWPLTSPPRFASTNLLKSNLQKCIRRMERTKGLLTAQRWLTSDPGSFLRRWPIILVEDALVTTEFPALIWLMVAVTSHDYLLTRLDVAFILSTVYFAFSHSQMEEIHKPEVIFPPFKYLKASPLGVQALWIRAAYGGMEGDRKMLAGFAAAYHEVEVPPFVYDRAYLEGRPLSKADILDVSADFHVYPRSLDGPSGVLDIDPGDLKAAIWAHASGITHRKSVTQPSPREERLKALQAETLALWTLYQKYLGK